MTWFAIIIGILWKGLKILQFRKKELRPPPVYFTHCSESSSYHNFGCEGGLLCQRWFLCKRWFARLGWHSGRIRPHGHVSVALGQLIKRNPSDLVVLLPQLAQPQALILQLALQLQDLNLGRRRSRKQAVTEKADLSRLQQKSNMSAVKMLITNDPLP